MAENDDDKIGFSLDLDSKDMAGQLLSLKEQISSLGEARNLEGLISGLTEVGTLVGVVGVAYLGLKTIVDGVFDAEKIKQVNLQFNAMAKNAGLVGSSLKAGLIAATGGMATETEVLQAANRAFVELGTNANKLPETMELARKTTAIFGGEAVERFEQINHAIATGSERQLKQLGLQVDVNKAYADYAEKIGTTASALSEAGKQQALLNAVLEKGKETFKDVNDKTLEVTNTWKQLKVTFQEIGETFSLVFDKIIGPSLRTFLRDTKDVFNTVNLEIKKYLGDAQESSEASAQLLTKDINTIQKALTEVEKTGKVSYFGEWIDAGTENGKRRIQELKTQLQNLKSEVDKTKKEEPATETAKPRDTSKDIDQEKVKANRKKFEEELYKLHKESIEKQTEVTKSWAEKERLSLEKVEEENQKHKQNLAKIEDNADLTADQKRKLKEAEEDAHQDRLTALEQKRIEAKKQSIDEQMKMTTDFDQFDELVEQQKLNAAEERDFQLKQIKENEDLDDKQRKEQSLQIEQQYQAQITQIQMNEMHEREAMLHRWVYESNNAAEQFAKGFASGSMKAKASLMDFGAQGQKVFDIFTSHASNAFIQLGEGSKKGSEVMREAMLGMVADIAQYYGTMMLSAGIFPPNPPVLAAGAALLVLSGYLRSQSRKASGMDLGSVGGGSGMGDIGGVPSTFSAQSQLVQNTQQAKAVHIEVQGSIFDSDQTKQRLTQLVRDSIDATDFSISRIGGNQV